MLTPIPIKIIRRYCLLVVAVMALGLGTSAECGGGHG